jgi:hypothetical protein
VAFRPPDRASAPRLRRRPFLLGSRVLGHGHERA